MDVDIDPLDIDLEKDPLAAKVFKVGFHDEIVSLFVFLTYCVFFYTTLLLISSNQISNPSILSING